MGFYTVGIFTPKAKARELADKLKKSHLKTKIQKRKYAGRVGYAVMVSNTRKSNMDSNIRKTIKAISSYEAYRIRRGRRR